jgi:hypothetical protein
MQAILMDLASADLALHGYAEMELGGAWKRLETGIGTESQACKQRYEARPVVSSDHA